MRQYIIIITIIAIIYACGNKPSSDSNNSPKNEIAAASNPKGLGEIKNVSLNDPLDETMTKKGKAIYDMKCSACHKLSGSRVVGPSFAGVTSRRSPEWIMNMITNTDVMLEKDAEAQKLLEECLTRMPNQNVSVGDARDILEFLLQNDIDKKAATTK